MHFNFYFLGVFFFQKVTKEINKRLMFAFVDT